VILHQIKQNSEEWLSLRVGKFTASSASDLLMNKSLKGYNQLLSKIMEERFTGEACESKKFQGNSFTDRGHLFEPIAINDFETKYFYDVVEIGFIESDDHLYGCSPDGMINDNGMIQIKCPIFATQLEYLEKQTVPTNYYKQMQFELFVSEREYNIFYSYHPKLKEVYIKLERDEEMIEKIRQRIEEATDYIDGEIERIRCL